MKNRRYIAGFVCAMSLPVFLLAAPPAVLRTQPVPDNQYIGQGNTFAVDVVLDANRGRPPMSYAFRVRYNENALTLTRVEDRNLGGGAPRIAERSRSDDAMAWAEIRCAGAATNRNPQPVLCRLTFQIRGARVTSESITLAPDSMRMGLTDTTFAPLPVRFDSSATTPLGQRAEWTRPPERLKDEETGNDAATFLETDPIITDLSDITFENGTDTAEAVLDWTPISEAATSAPALRPIPPPLPPAPPLGEIEPLEDVLRAIEALDDVLSSETPRRTAQEGLSSPSPPPPVPPVPPPQDLTPTITITRIQNLRFEAGASFEADVILTGAQTYGLNSYSFRVFYPHSAIDLTEARDAQIGVAPELGDRVRDGATEHRAVWMTGASHNHNPSPTLCRLIFRIRQTPTSPIHIEVKGPALGGAVMNNHFESVPVVFSGARLAPPDRRPPTPLPTPRF